MREIMVLTTEGEKNEIVYSVYDSELYSILQSYAISTPTHRKGKKQYYNIACTFDIETTLIENHTTPSESLSFMYHWQFCIHDTVVFGRTHSEYITLFNMLKDIFNLSDTTRLCIYIHNLAYEFQFIKDYIAPHTLFAKSKRKPIYFTHSGIEFRCSYFLSNKSLEKFCSSTPTCTYYKLSGELFDYKKIRTPRTKLLPYELSYMYNDVRGLSQCIQHLLLDDTIASIPLTNTGYVRRDARKAMNTPTLRAQFMNNALTDEQYTLLRKIFRGGNTHANRYYAGVTLHEVESYDLSSSYIASMILDYYPVTPLQRYNPTSESDFLLKCATKCVMMSITFLDITLKTDIPIPYIDIAHCENRYNIKNDNGRVLSADMITYYCTEIDLQIIRSQYDYSTMKVETAFTSERGYLPDEYISVLLKYYDAKTSLKNSDEYEYMKSKNRLNACFGMMVTDISHSEIEYNAETHEWDEDKPDLEEALDSYYNSRNSFLQYQHGVYITAHSRARLQRGIDYVSEDTVYVDTDSVKYIGSHASAFKDLNEYHISKCNNSKHRCYSDFDSKRYYLGVWEHDASYTRFKTFGAKKYAYDDESGFHITVAGINKENGAKIIGSLENFTLSTEYSSSIIDGIETKIGRTVAYYNESTPHDITIDGCTFSTASNISILDTTYTLGVTDEYFKLIEKNT